MTFTLPEHHRALVLESVEAGFQVKDVPTPRPEPGSAILRIEAAGIVSYHREIYNGFRQYPFPTPLVGGYSAIGRIAAIGPDATVLQPGQLVYADCVITARDDSESIFLTAIHEGFTDGTKKLIKDVWRDGYWAEYAKVPLENIVLLDETRLCKDLGYSVQELIYMSYLMVPFGGLRDIKLEPGEVVVVCPATGGYGGAGVMVAIAMGARVIAMGRNENELSRLKAHVLESSPKADIETVKMTGDEMVDAATLKAFGTIDAVLDFTPPQASKSPHLRSAIWSLRRGGRVSLMGFHEDPFVPIIMGKNLSLHGKLMYARNDMVLFVKMLERGLFPRGRAFTETKTFKLQDWKFFFSKEALNMAAEHTGIGKFVNFTP
ncbi:chaperonin 10-like protein [Lophiotrema nucula]|uniref:Chaperonin 10-like protein n=1 Tax=Lophiotrema nucula TaxID=690887 RepID=A0A6A5YK83_9PLEO|nr:chaperonin 10-like protein [Lophiotrema nucula]